MSLLDDKSLVERQLSNPLVKKLVAPDDWYTVDSPIQASSIDLHIGKILLPGKAGKDDGSADQPLELHALESGQTAIVSTSEELCLPSDIAAIGFPPSHISVKGILMTNPGHVDPGYTGPMRFTVINMGREPYVLKSKEPIVTLLFLELTRASQRSWVQRRGGKAGGPPTQSDLNRLSPDFLDVQARAEEIVKRKIEDANIKLRRFEIGMTLVGGAIGALILAFLPYFTGMQDLKTKVSELDKSLNVTNIQQQVSELERKIRVLEQNGVPAPKQPIQPSSATTK